MSGEAGKAGKSERPGSGKRKGFCGSRFPVPGSRIFRLFAAALFVSVSCPGLLSAKQTGCLECHSGLLRDKQGKAIHSPVAAAECLSCHQPVSGKRHPADKGSIALVIKGAALCLSCHEDKYKQRFPHGPVAGGSCLFCHDPHSSGNRMLLKKFGSALCFDCHDRSLANGQYVHEPVGYGECTACHDVHGSAYRRLLKQNFSEAFYLSYSSANYALCFICHNKEIPLDQRTDTITGFRNGDRNLHYLHINKADKGRSCKACHDPHTAGQERLVKESVPGFGKWDIPMFFTKTATGGTCVVGCHKPKSYDRKNAADYR
ncbi:MAG: cytochrome C family [Geobacteraceae bacterium]|nr:MAG: cytochrome C family [Geobacteraceae bacterium]